MKIDTFIIGAPKCGTTALASYLAEHPEVCVAKGKETYFFMTDHWKDWKRRIGGSVDEFYERVFPHFDPDRHKVVIEATPMYLFSRGAVPNILKYNPEARFIVMLRDPVELVQSWHAQLLWNLNSENVRSLEKAWRLQEVRKRGEEIPSGCEEPVELQYRDICCLGDQCERLLESVSGERVLFLFHQDLRSSPRSVYQQALQFLDVSDDGRAEFAIVNERKARKSKVVARLAVGLFRLKEKLFPGRHFGVSSRLLSSNRKSVDKEVLSPLFRNELVHEFGDQVDKIRRITSRDVRSEDKPVAGLTDN